MYLTDGLSNVSGATVEEFTKNVDEVEDAVKAFIQPIIVYLELLVSKRLKKYGVEKMKFVDIVFAIVISLACIFLIIYIKIKNTHLENCNFYTIGVVSEVNHYRFKSNIYFRYKIKNREVTQGELLYKDNIRKKVKVGQKYIVRFCIDDISNGALLFNNPVGDSIILNQIYWDSIPVKTDEY